MNLKLKLPFEQAVKEVRRIDHATCQKAIPRRFQVTADGSISEQSVLWLFCWANNGMGSVRAAEQARQAFNRSFDHGYDWLAARTTLDEARSRRYKD